MIQRRSLYTAFLSDFEKVELVVVCGFGECVIDDNAAG
jgi:hypothetical protein